MSAPSPSLTWLIGAPSSDVAVDELAGASPARRARWIRWARWALADVAAWAVVTLIFSAQVATRGTGMPFRDIVIDEIAGFLPCALLTPFVAVLALRFPFTERVRVRTVLAHLAGIAVFTVGGGALMGFFEWFLPWNGAGKTLVEYVRSRAVWYFSWDVLIYWMIASVVTSIAYARQARLRAVRSARLQAQLAEAQLHALGAKLQPHFLFNTLHVISALVRHDPRRAEQLIARLSELLRQMLSDSERVECALEEELAFLEKYIDIQEARFGPRLRVEFRACADVLSARVPRLVLQPLVENAIRHGVAPRSAPGTVVVDATRDAGVLTLTVADDGIGVPPDGPVRDGVGLATTRARLRGLYGNAASLVVAPGADGGTVSTIRIPYIPVAMTA